MVTGGKITEHREGVALSAVAEMRPPETKGALSKRKPRERKPKPHPLEGKVVRGSGPAYWLIENGRRRLISSMEEFYRIGLQAVLRLPDEELEDIPLGVPIRW